MFGVTGGAARALGWRANQLRMPDSPPQSILAFYNPALHTPRGNQLRNWSLRLGAVALVSFIALALLVILGHATCWAVS